MSADTDAGGPDRDPGLQPERTRLAWRRTTLSATVVAVLAAKTALQGGAAPVPVVAAALCCVLWLGFQYLAHRRIRSLASASRPRALPPPYAAAAALCTVALAVCGAALVL
ncbi:DUF202 domain-containing protein [Streptomyces lancefieldiae]|uniref:DUF202 domain-containing protein n=1 Tax=Streptomyces lancefieldiae TaxID=3075520 RepID=A0ABU3AN07_9ACTN|nr:DUF202 domain-containing protein [Streptomyces sp. DSM 40712]MDT0611343.1 DUF202 domain-containing protein [Streptomyces sp. DSM 40712]